MTFQVTQGCTLCGLCAVACPVGAIRIAPRGAVIDQALCVGCGTCRDNCASEAITPAEDGKGEASCI